MAAVLVMGAGVGAATNYVWQDSPNPTPPYTSWETAAHVIQDAVDAASDGDTVLVTDGVYRTGGRPVGTSALTNRVAVDKPLSLMSVNGAEVTVIEGHQVPTDSFGLGDGAIRCVYLSDGGSLIGFTLTNGATRSHGANPREQCAGGVLCGSTNVLVSQCLVVGNAAYEEGGGVSGGILEECKISGNFSWGYGGGVADSRLKHCDLVGNSSYYGGGAVGSTLNHCILLRNSVTGGLDDNYGGGAANCTLNNCILSGNSCDTTSGSPPTGEGGGAVYSTLNNCLLTDNSAPTGGGAGDSTLNNCTLAGNSATFGGGVAWSSLRNCIVYFNSATYGSNYLSGGLNYTCTYPMPTNGVGNITNAPLFVDTNGWADLRLRPDSPCIDAGNNDFVTSLTDLDGNPRILNGIVDMGAYEFVPLTPTQLVEQLIAQVSASDLKHKQPLLATLNAALASIERGNCHSAIGQLGAFQNKVRAQVAKKDFALAMQLIQGAQQVIAALDCDGSSHVAAKIRSLKRHNGKMQMEIKGEAGKAYILEASTNLVDWKPICVVRPDEEGNCCYEDVMARKQESRFYRVVTK